MITHLRRGDTRSLTAIARTRNASIYVAGFDGNGQFHTGLTDLREPTEQRSIVQRSSIENSAQRADLSALRTPLPQAPLSAYAELRQ
jgi:hypothetical protein